MKRSRWAVLAIPVMVAGVTLGHEVRAGEKSTFAVTVDTTNREFGGAMGSARNSSNSTERLYCSINSSSTGSVYGTCHARNAAGTSVSCTTTNSTLLDTIRAIGSDSYLSIIYDTSGACSAIRLYQGSMYAPKAL